jgi:hypothetical protein
MLEPGGIGALSELVLLAAAAAGRHVVGAKETLAKPGAIVR